MGAHQMAAADPKFMLFFRSALFVGLGSVVATIIYLTPIPDEFPQSCRRRCHELDWPMICRIKLYVEEIPCRVGPGGYCAMVNRHTPGPLIQVCENDIVMVDVVNRLPGRSLSVHWRGQQLTETPYMDGVNMVTQCPILPHTTFQYKFRASQPGTHMWQLNPVSGADSVNLFGAFIVMQSDTREVQRYLYDTDDSHHVLLITADRGKIIAKSSLQAGYKVTAGVRHRWRVMYGGQASQCRVAVSMDDLTLTVIALDGHPVKPLQTASVEIAFGERVDVVVEATESTEQRHLHLEPISCVGVEGSTVSIHVLPSLDKQLNAPTARANSNVRTIVDDKCTEDITVCLDGLESLAQLPVALNSSIMDNKIMLMFGVRPIPAGSNASVIAPVDESDIWGAPHINNVTMVLPSSPLMTQMADIDPNLLCNSPCSTPGAVCECLHVLHIPRDETVEILLVHQGGGGAHHLFHLHGNSFFVVGGGQLNRSLTTEEALELERKDQLVLRDLTSPVVKDSVSVPKYGIIALRFIASNPGFWLLDQELSYFGMQVVLHVGSSSDIPDTPKDYPRCGSWVGPEFFLA